MFELAEGSHFYEDLFSECRGDVYFQLIALITKALSSEPFPKTIHEKTADMKTLL